MHTRRWCSTGTVSIAARSRSPQTLSYQPPRASLQPSNPGARHRVTHGTRRQMSAMTGSALIGSDAARIRERRETDSVRGTLAIRPALTTYRGLAPHWLRFATLPWLPASGAGTSPAWGCAFQRCAPQANSAAAGAGEAPGGRCRPPDRPTPRSRSLRAAAARRLGQRQRHQSGEIDRSAGVSKRGD